MFILKDYNEEYITCTGKFESPKEGEDIEVRGRYVEHEKYGRQFDASSVEKLKPDNMGAAKTYLLNLGIKGFGEKSVEKVLEYFGIRILEILREERPEEIKDVPGLRKSVKDELFNTLLGEGILSDLNHFFESHHISSKWSRIVYTYYGVQSVARLPHFRLRFRFYDLHPGQHSPSVRLFLPRFLHSPARRFPPLFCLFAHLQHPSPPSVRSCHSTDKRPVLNL